MLFNVPFLYINFYVWLGTDTATRETTRHGVTATCPRAMYIYQGTARYYTFLPTLLPGRSQTTAKRSCKYSLAPAWRWCIILANLSSSWRHPCVHRPGLLSGAVSVHKPDQMHSLGILFILIAPCIVHCIVCATVSTYQHVEKISAALP